MKPHMYARVTKKNITGPTAAASPAPARHATDTPVDRAAVGTIWSVDLTKLVVTVTVVQCVVAVV